MKKPKHTPGPWIEAGSAVWSAKLGSDTNWYRETVCCANHNLFVSRDPRAEFAANVSLIAAAPELLTARRESVGAKT